MKNFGRRLRTAIKRHAEGGSIRRFQQSLANVRGSSYRMVHAYLKGEALPSLEFVQEAARVLGVREAWLLTGIGEMTAEEEAVREESDGIIEVARLRGPLADSTAVQAMFIETVRRIVQYVSSVADPPSSEDTKQIARQLAGFVYDSPLHRIVKGLESKEVHSDEEYQDYAVAMLHAVALSIPDPLAIGRLTGIVFSEPGDGRDTALVEE